MTPDVARLFAEALRLPSEARAAVACALLASLDGTPDKDAVAAWTSEITRRLDEIRSGDVRAISWHEARRQIIDGSRWH